MQTTLLALALALIAALLAALAGPLVIDWRDYRAAIETETGRIVGVDVRIKGAIDARLLPSPRVVLHDIELGRDGGLRAGELSIEFGLGPLMRGEWRADEMRLVAPEVHLGLDASGRVTAPAVALNFNPEALSIDRFSVRDGKAVLGDAAGGGQVVLEKISFDGEVRSLLGPVRGEGAFAIGGTSYPYRINAGRLGEDGSLKLRANVDPVNRPFGIEADGVLTLANNEPRFEGTLDLARPVGLALRGSDAAVTQPWRIGGKIKVTTAAALMQEVEFQYGSEEQGIKLTGTADFKFGRQPRFDGVLSGRQVDLDRLSAGEATRLPPAAAIRQWVQIAGAAFRPAIPIQIGIGIDAVTLGGNTIQSLRGDISTADGGWSLDRLEFRAPGFTQVRLSGRLAVNPDGVTFTGPASFEASEPGALAAWLEGRPEPAEHSMRALKVRGDVTIGNERIAVERLNAGFDRESVTGRLAYIFETRSRPSRLEAEIAAPELDLDAALGFANAFSAGSTFQRPHDIAISADIGRARIAGIEARNASARLKLEAGDLQVEKLSVEDLGGASFSANGRVVTSGAAHGMLNVDLAARDLGGVTALLGKFMPDAAAPFRRAAPSMVPAKLRARLNVDSAPEIVTKIGMEGTAGGLRVNIDAQANADVTSLFAAGVRFDGKLEADDGRALLRVLGLDRAIAVDRKAGVLTLNASGPAYGDLKIESRLSSGALASSVSGTARLFAGEKRTATLQAKIAGADASPLRPAGDKQGVALPVNLDAKLVLSGDDLAIDDLSGSVAGSDLRGKLSLKLGASKQINGELTAGNIDGALIAAAIGMPGAAGQTWNWSGEPFSSGAFAAWQGAVALKASSVTLAGNITGREVQTTLRLSPDEFAFDGLAGELGGGRFAGNVSFHDGDGLQVRSRFTLTNADAATFFTAAPPPVSGRVDLEIDVQGSGLSPVALVGSLRGSGKVTLRAAQFAGLDPRIFETVTAAVDNGLPSDTNRITDTVSTDLDAGRLSIPQFATGLVINAGQLRIDSVTAKGEGGDVSVDGNLDLLGGAIDARLVLLSAKRDTRPPPGVFVALKGPLAAPARTVDVTAFAGWLTLRQIEQQTKKLEAMEGKPSRGEAARPASTPNVRKENAPALPAPMELKPAARQPTAPPAR